MNLVFHSGCATGDNTAQVMTWCEIDDRCSTDLLGFGTVAPLDAPHNIPTGRMLALPERRHYFNPDPEVAVQFQEQARRP